MKDEAAGPPKAEQSAPEPCSIDPDSPLAQDHGSPFGRRGPTLGSGSGARDSPSPPPSPARERGSRGGSGAQGSPSPPPSPARERGIQSQSLAQALRPTPVAYRGELGRIWVIVVATALAQSKRWSAYLIDVIRMPLSPLLMFATWRITYAVAGHSTVDGANVSGFLLVGMIGVITWTSTIWASGYAIETERSEGTAAALFLSPASRNAVVLGYGFGSFLWLLPSFLVVIALGFATGARLQITDPLAVTAAFLALALGSLACGFAFAGLFVLSRRGNLLANFLQTPIFLLAGFVVPRSSLPGWVQPFSNILPVSHAVDALRASSLAGAGFSQTIPQILLAIVTSAVFALVGAVGLRRVEYAAKRSGALDLY